MSQKILKLALDDEHRRKNNLCVIFITKDKFPGLKKWQKYAKENQGEEEIKGIYKKKNINNTGYSYFTGIGGLIDIDFDWEWAYHLAVNQFKERMNTRTIRTPNGGYRALFIVDNPESFLKYKQIPPHVEIHGTPNHHVVVVGKAKDDNGDLKEYKLEKDLEIRHDNEILEDIKSFLSEINEKCDFLEYNCIKGHIKHKKNHLTHEQRTSIGSFFAANNVPIKTAIGFFRTCDNFEYKSTEEHMEKLYEKEFSYPKCETLKTNFNWNEDNCDGCLRHQSDLNKQIDLSTAENELNISNLDLSDIFRCIDNNGSTSNTKMVENTIFTLNNEIFFATSLKSVMVSNELKKIIGVYGSKSGYGFYPLTFNTENLSAISEAVLMDMPQIYNENQYRTIEFCINECLSKAKNIEKTVNGVFAESPILELEDIPNEILEKLKYYTKLDNEMHYLVITCWILGTYLFPLFSTYGYLILTGEKGAGKGTILDLLQKMCWNATSKLISLTEATLFRIIDEQTPSMIIDEYHRIANGSMGNAIVALLESGYEKGGVVLRAEQIKKEDGTRGQDVAKYSVYSPKALATRTSVEADDKGIKIVVPKITSDILYAKRKKELISDKFFEYIRDDIMRWVINNQSVINKAYNEIEPTEKLSGRSFNVWLGVLAISKVAFPEKYKLFIEFAENEVDKLQSNYSEKENRVLTALNSKYPNFHNGGMKLKEDSFLISNSEINNALNELDGEGLHHTQIKSALENLKLVGYYEKGIYYIEREKLSKKLVERGFNKGDDDLMNVSESPYVKESTNTQKS